MSIHSARRKSAADYQATKRAPRTVEPKVAKEPRFQRIAELDGLIATNDHAAKMRVENAANINRRKGQELALFRSKISLRQITEAVAEMTGVSVYLMRAKGNCARPSQARHLAMYVARQVTPYSYPQIGRWFGGRHHTTIMYAVRKVEWRRRIWPQWAKAAERLVAELEKPTKETP